MFRGIRPKRACRATRSSAVANHVTTFKTETLIGSRIRITQARPLCGSHIATCKDVY